MSVKYRILLLYCFPQLLRKESINNIIITILFVITNGNDLSTEEAQTLSNSDSGDESLGKKSREIRGLKGWTLKQIAEISSLNVNTLSLIENGKNSPSVSTLQSLPTAMNVPIKDFLEPIEPITPVVFTKQDQRPQALNEKSIINNLGKGLSSSTLEPFVLTMEKFTTSGGRSLT